MFCVAWLSQLGVIIIVRVRGPDRLIFFPGRDAWGLDLVIVIILRVIVIIVVGIVIVIFSTLTTWLLLVLLL